MKFKNAEPPRIRNGIGLKAAPDSFKSSPVGTRAQLTAKPVNRDLEKKGYNKLRLILRNDKFTKSDDRLANANKAAAPRTGAR